MLILAGGWNVEVLGSTEVLDYTKYLDDEEGSKWMQVCWVFSTKKGSAQWVLPAGEATAHPVVGHEGRESDRSVPHNRRLDGGCGRALDRRGRDPRLEREEVTGGGQHDQPEGLASCSRSDRDSSESRHQYVSHR